MKTPLIIFLGECNACGFLSKNRLTAEDQGEHPQVRILNNLTLKVEPLDLRTNNSLQHATLKDNRSYGWELFLAKQVGQKLWPTNPVYLVKAGQGGTRAMDFRYNKMSYYTIFIMRVRAMQAQIDNLSPIIWYQQGANEPKERPDSEDFTDCVVKLFEMVEADLGTFPIIMTKMMPATLWLNPAVEEIAKRVPRLRWVDTEEANIGCKDGQHWLRGGYELTAELLRKESLELLK